MRVVETSAVVNHAQLIGTSVAPIIGSAIGYRPIIAIVQYIGCLSDSTYRYSIYAHALYEPRVAESANI